MNDRQKHEQKLSAITSERLQKVKRHDLEQLAEQWEHVLMYAGVATPLSEGSTANSFTKSTPRSKVVKL